MDKGKPTQTHRGVGMKMNDSTNEPLFKQRYKSRKYLQKSNGQNNKTQPSTKTIKFNQIS